MTMTLKAASEAVGMNKVTVLRAIQKGKISATKNEDGEWLIEPSELFRVYVPVEQRTDTNTNATQPGALQAEINGLKQVAELLRSELDDVRRDRDHWRDTVTATLRALPAITPAPPAQRSWWNLRRAG